jgi:hypothetical protein
MLGFVGLATNLGIARLGNRQLRRRLRAIGGLTYPTPSTRLGMGLEKRPRILSRSDWLALVSRDVEWRGRTVTASCLTEPPLCFSDGLATQQGC